jgi:hypothetical protein
VELLSDKVEPRWRKSSTENEEPSFAQPYIDKVLPNRKKDRSETDEPMCTKSRTVSDEPRRVNPYMEQEEPRRQKLLKLRLEPKYT